MPCGKYLASLRADALNPKGFSKFMPGLEIVEPIDRNKFARVADECGVVISCSESDDPSNFEYIVYGLGLSPAKGQVEIDPDPEGGDDVCNLELR